MTDETDVSDPATEPESDIAASPFDDELAKVLMSHVPLLVTLGGFGLAVVKVARVADGNLNTALALISSSGAATILFGLALTIFKVAAFTVLWYGMLFVIYKKGTQAQRSLVGGAVTVGAWVALMAFPSVWTFVWVAGMFGVLVGLSFAVRKGRVKWLGSIVTIGVVAVALGSAAITDAPWLPLERIGTTNNGVIVGYPVSNDQGWFTILRDDPRVVLRLPSDEVESQTLCESNFRC